MKKKALACMLAGILALSIFGCGSSGGSKSMMEEMAVADSAAYDTGAGDNSYSATEEAAVDDAADETVTSENGIEELQESNRKLIRTVNISLQTREYDTLLENLSNKVKELGGYIQDSSVWGSNLEYSSTRSANYTLRIPSDKLDEFIDAAETLGNVTYKNETVDDVTLRYVDVESHKKALETERDRLMTLLEQAESVEDIITIENRLSEVRYELENYESQIRLLDNQIDYSTVYVDVTEVSRMTDTGKQGFFEEVTSRFSDSIYMVVMGFREFAVWILGSLPILVVWGVILAIVLFLLRKFVFKKSGKHKKNTEENIENTTKS